MMVMLALSGLSSMMTKWVLPGGSWVCVVSGLLWHMSAPGGWLYSANLISDEVSAVILSLTFGVGALMFVSMDGKFSLPINLVVVSLLGVVTLVFSAVSLLLFYISFEVSLVPMLLIILGWGAQPERLMAGLYMFFYTLVSSLPLLGLILFHGSVGLTHPVGFLSTGTESLILVLPFAVKMPIYLLHLWLPKAHVEAPVYGSMVLAATLLKIGSYGVWRVSPTCSPSALSVVGSVAFLGASLCCIVTISQSDIKSLIAYSSVVHMGMLFFLICSGLSNSYPPSLMMMIAHGVCSSGMFCGATLLYGRFSGRNLLLMQGALWFTPSLAFPWVALILSNLSAPPSLGLLSETVMISASMSLSSMCGLGVSVMVVLVLVYSLMLFFNLTHGKPSLVLPEGGGSVKELILLYSHGMFGAVWPLGFWMFQV